jgi:hypothetical protein
MCKVRPPRRVYLDEVEINIEGGSEPDKTPRLQDGLLLACSNMAIA